MQTQFAPLIQLLSLGVVFLNLVSVLLIAVYFLTAKPKKKDVLTSINNFMRENSISIAFIVTAIATVGSLFLSEIVKLAPCTLCWYQRAFMYPQVIILGIGLYLNDHRVKIYALALSIIGLLIAIYHIILQYNPYLPCSTTEIVSCSLKQFEYFGYVTIPVMSATAFVAVIIVLLFGLRKKPK